MQGFVQGLTHIAMLDEAQCFKICNAIDELESKMQSKKYEEITLGNDELTSIIRAHLNWLDAEIEVGFTADHRFYVRRSYMPVSVVTPVVAPDPRQKVCRLCKCAYTDTSRTNNRKKCYTCTRDPAEQVAENPTRSLSKERPYVKPTKESLVGPDIDKAVNQNLRNKKCEKCGVAFYDQSAPNSRKYCGQFFCKKGTENA